MEAVTFKTDNGNYYLYSPSQGVILPIQQEVANLIITKNCLYSKSSIYKKIEKSGLLNKEDELFNAHITPQDIKNSLANLPQIVFEVTSSCNLSCVYCCYKDGYNTFKDRAQGKLNPQIAKLILNHLCCRFSELTPSNTPFVISFYGGEPLLALDVIKEIVEYVNLLDFNGRKVIFSMTTNGVLLNKDIDFLVSNNFHLLVSLDGDRNGNSYRIDKNGHEAFDTVINNLQFIKKKYPSYFKTIRYNSVYTDKSSIKDIILFFRKNFGKTPSISPLLEPDDNSKDAEMIRKMIKAVDIPNNIEDDYEMFVEIPIHKSLSSILINLIRNTFFNEIAYQKRNAKKYYTGTCIPFSKRMFITNDGKITLCEKITRTYSYGTVDIKRGSVEFDEQAIANKFNIDIINHSLRCKSCYLQKFCNQCVYSFKNGKCPLYKNKEMFSNYMSKVFTYLEDHPSIVKAVRNKILIK